MPKTKNKVWHVVCISLSKQKELDMTQSNEPMTNQDFEEMVLNQRNSKRSRKSAKRAAREERVSKKTNHNFHDTAEMFDYYKNQNLPSSLR